MLSRRKKLLKNLCKKEFEKKGDRIDESQIESIIKDREN
jgi:hypothetical protein